MKTKALLMIVFLFFWATLIQAAVPRQINYQGRLTDAVGKALDGTYTIRFYLYDAPAGGILLWNEEQSVVVADGIYNVQLGSVSPLGSDVFSGDEVYLEVVIYHAATTSWETLSPRQQLTSTAYAFQTENAQSLEGHASVDFASAIHQHSGADITTGSVDEARIDPDIARDSEIAWTNLLGIPPEIADGDQVGITTETDPTITDPSIKDGVSWGELSAIPADFADGIDNVGMTTSSDYGRSGVSSTLYEGSTALTNKYVGKSGSQTITNGNLTVNTPFGTGAAAVTGVKGFAQSATYGFGVLGQANGSSAYGIYGSASGAYGRGVHAEATSTGDTTNYGGYFLANGKYGHGVHAEATSTGDGINYGGYFLAQGINGRGAYGYATGAGGSGVYGIATNLGYTSNYGGYFEARGPNGRGVYAKAPKTGIDAEATEGLGVAVRGRATNTEGGTNWGGYFYVEGPYSRGVTAYSEDSNAIGVEAIASGTYGMGVIGSGGQYDFYANGFGQDYGSSSSIRWKQNIVEIDNALEMVMQMRGVYFDWDEEHGGRHDMGFIAEEVGQQVPEIVVFEENSEYASGMDYGKMTPILLQAIKEQQEIISELRAEIEAIKDEIKTIKAIK